MEKSEAMTLLRDKAAHWFAHAAAMTRLAADVVNLEARRTMLAVAGNYMKNAHDAAARADAQPDDASF